MFNMCPECPEWQRGVLKFEKSWKQKRCPKCVPRLAGQENAGEKSGKPVKAVRAVRIVRYCPCSVCRGREDGTKNSMLEDCLPRLREAERVSKMCIDGVQNVKNRTELRMLSVNVSPNRLP